jgi:hypothetical protein
MSAPDVLWRLAEAYGELIGMGLGLIMVGVVIAMILLHREVQWKDVVLGLSGVLLLGISLWMSHDLETAKRRPIQPKVDEWLTRLTNISNRLHRTLGSSTCQPKRDYEKPDQYLQVLLSDSFNVISLVGAVKAEVGTSASDD